MRTLFTVLMAGLALCSTVRADNEVKAKADVFAEQMFAAKPDKDKNYACFVRSYDPGHLTRHPLQKVKAMKLLVTGETNAETKNFGYSFRLAVNFRNRSGAFDSSGDCGVGGMTDSPADKTVMGCSVDCDGGGVTVEMTPDNKSALVRLDRIRIWQNNKPDDEGFSLSGGADDRVFRLDRARLDMCKSLITDRAELAAMRTLKKD